MALNLTQCKWHERKVQDLIFTYIRSKKPLSLVFYLWQTPRWITPYPLLHWWQHFAFLSLTLSLSLSLYLSLIISISCSSPVYIKIYRTNIDLEFDFEHYNKHTKLFYDKNCSKEQNRFVVMLIWWKYVHNMMLTMTGNVISLINRFMEELSLCLILALIHLLIPILRFKIHTNRLYKGQI